MAEIVRKGDFPTNNFLSTEFRVPVTLLRTNACSPLAMNALADNIWDNFSSQSYKELPAVGDITYRNPFDGTEHTYKMSGGGQRLYAARLLGEPLVDGAISAQQHGWSVLRRPVGCGTYGGLRRRHPSDVVARETQG
jgi:hypothetical protein